MSRCGGNCGSSGPPAKSGCPPPPCPPSPCPSASIQTPCPPSCPPPPCPSPCPPPPCPTPCPSANSQKPNCDICSTGCKQSPILICSAVACDADMMPLKFNNHWIQDICLSMTLKHNSVSLTPPSQVKMTINGGPLRGCYNFDGVHFHWGESDRNGTEHTIDGEKFAMEAHLVYYSNKYCNISEALGKPEGVAVIAVLMESKPSFHNCNLDPVISNLSNLKCPGSVATISKNVLKMFKEVVESQEYFAYEGSLTTPPCSEGVIWMVFKNPLCIHCSQVEPFRCLTNEEGKPIRSNIRCPQLLNGRTVYSARVNPCPCP